MDSIAVLMMFEFKWWLLLSSLWVYLEVRGQLHEMHSKYLTTEHGLSNSSVKFVTQDHQGFMWFGTTNGLNRFEGYTFKVYKHQPGDTSTLTDNLTNVIYEDRDSLLWVGSTRPPCG